MGLRPFPAPYDTPLDFNQVYSLAAPFFVSCPASNPTLDLKAFPKLTVGSPGPFKTGDTITLLTSGYVLAPGATQDNSTGQLYGAFLAPTGPIFVNTTLVNGGYRVVVPTGVDGQTYAVLSSCNDKVSDAYTAAGPAILEVQI